MIHVFPAMYAVMFWEKKKSGHLKEKEKSYFAYDMFGQGVLFLLYKME